MGLIRAMGGAVGGTLADQWKEYFYCEAMDADVLVCKGQKRVSGRSSNTKGSDNIITNGSVVAVNEGQCMIIVEQGKVVELCSEPGEFVYDTSTEPSIFEGKLSKSIKEVFATIGKRFTFGGDTAKDQRIYYFNTKEIIGNKYGTPNPVPFRVVDNNIGLDVDISIRCNGEYSYKIVNPILFYTNVCGNVEEEYERSEIDSMLKTELLTALQPAFAKISDMGIRYSALPGHTMEIADALNAVLSKKWAELRGIEIASFGINSVTASKEDEEMIKQLQKTAVLQNPNMAAATLVGAQGEAMKAAASNPNGAMTGFMGMGMVQNSMGTDAHSLFAMGQQQRMQQQNQAQQLAEQEQRSVAQAGQPGHNNAAVSNEVSDGWVCECGISNTGKFCVECGKPKPQPVQGWVCSCGTVNKGKFCMECGAKKPAEAPLYKCDKCGWEPEDPKNPPKFCPECGDPFDDNDIQK
ncbi:SPFH domain-containing protein [Butyribacter sp.]|uniref:SPFH domain-containing protein n=1 Tax=Butyribacter sp. TaxID=2822465 RepID=UPI002A993EF0|nr:SPFH domain-containing protein [Butyribacter sp.]